MEISCDEKHQYLWAFLLTVVGMVVGVVTISRSIKRNKKLPPGPWRIPIIGNVHQMMLMNRQLEPHERIAELAKKHGPVMRLQLGELDNIIISSAEAAEQVMKTHDVVLASRPPALAFNIIFYGCKDVAFAPYGEHWRQMRKLCVMELLSARRVLSFRPIRLQEVSNFVASIAASASNGEVVDLKARLLSLTNRITARSTFGMAPKLSERFVPIVEDILSSFLGFGLSDLFPSVKFLPILSGYRSKLVALHRAADSVLEEVINEHIAKRESRASSTSKVDDDETEDLVDILLNFRESDDLAVPVTMDTVKGVLLDMFSGGTDTAASTMDWTMAEIIKNPSVMQRAQAEVRSVFRDNVDEERLHELEYLNAVIKESFRMHPTAPILLPREGDEKVEINGFEIPAKSRLMVHVWAIGRDPNHWTEPEKFNPERFLNSIIDFRGSHFPLIPFGAGRRMCPGIQFAMVVVQLTLANLLFHFDWKLPNGMEPEGLDMTEHFDASLRRKEKLCLIPMAVTNNARRP